MSETTMKNSKYNTLIWDLDGTLMDSLEDLCLAVNHALRAFGMPERTLDEVRRFVGNGVGKLVERATPDGLENPQFEAVFAEFKKYYVEHCREHTGLYPGIAETLCELKRRGVRMAVVSNKLQAGVDELYETYFKDTIAVAVGERVGTPRKPAPGMVRLALDALGADASEAVYVGDSDVDVATAHNAGLPCVSVLWGFRDRDFLLAHGATDFVSRPEELLRFFSV